MNKESKILLWLGATVGLSVLAAIMFHPAVFPGTIIGVAMTIMKQIHLGE